MKLTRLALIAAPVALSLAACSGGSNVIGNNYSGQSANIRFVVGSPDLGSNVDIYYQQANTAAPTAPANPSTTNVGYGTISTFFSEPPTAATVVVRSAGASSGSPALLGISCPIPQLASNGKYTVVIAGAGSTHSCVLFQDLNYTSAPQYRFHNAALAAATTQTFGVTNGTNTFVVNGSATVGASAASAGATFTQITPTNLSPAANAAFAVGAAGAVGTTQPASNTLPYTQLYASGSTAQPNTAGSLNYPNTAGTSVFAVDCTGGTGPTNRPCVNNVALIGTFDTL